MKEGIEALIKNKEGSPFLFVGSGFSRRYIGLEDWKGLIRKFSEGVGDFDYFLASANGNYPKAASLLADAFHDRWWNDERYANSREKFKATTKSRESALKNEIALYMAELNLRLPEDEGLKNELDVLRHANVDGIITTNWDLLLEEIFPEYRVYVGQEQLLFSNPQSIAEIYKIHGSCEAPNSIVLTEADYDNFHKNNPYLAAKLITIFIEHPIIFIGYSINDPNISEIIFSIASCLGEDKIEVFAENLIFLRRASGKGDSIQSFTFTRDGRNINAKIVETDNFALVYDVIAENKRKIPARILRYCKEQMFELVKSSNPEEKLAVLDIDDLDERDNVEFVVGVGVVASVKEAAAAAPSEGYADSGYQGFERPDLLEDVVRSESKLDADKVLRFVLPKIRRSGAVFSPMFRYLQKVGITSEAELRASEYTDAIALYDKMKGKPYQYGSTYRAAYYKNWDGKSADEILEGVGNQKAAIYLAYLPKNQLDQDWLRGYLEDNLGVAFSDPYSSAFSKLICYYDWLFYGFPQTGQIDVVAEIVGGTA